MFMETVITNTRSEKIVNGIVKQRGNWIHERLREWKKKSPEERELLIQHVRWMKNNFQKDIEEDLVLYNKIRSKLLDLNQEDFEDKAIAWKKVLDVDPQKKIGFMQNAQDFVHWGPNSSDEEIERIKKLLVGQELYFGDIHKISRHLDIAYRKLPFSRLPNLISNWPASESLVVREEFWKKKIAGESSIIEEIIRRKNRQDADLNNYLIQKKYRRQAIDLQREREKADEITRKKWGK